MPSPLVYELILNLTEAGDFEKAAALFHNRFFQRAEGGTNVRQVWLEMQIQRTLSLAKHGQCSEAIHVADHVAEPVSDLAFTRDGLEPFLRSARFTYLLGSVYKSCNLPERARSSFKQAAEQSRPEDAVWSWRASQELPDFDERAAKQRLQNILERTNRDGDMSSRNGWLLYNAGMLDRAVGNTQRAEKEFREAFLRPDQLMTYHLMRMELSGSNR
jgi:tetratricopeptide (TPR) repeat protein